MPTQSRSLDNALGARVRQLIAEGHLPVLEEGHLPVLLAEKIHGGYGSVSKCDVCAQPIEHNQVEYEVEHQQLGKTLSFHLGCYVLWQLACLEAYP
jgi:hypothetical protein